MVKKDIKFNKGKALSVAICITILQGQITGPMFTSIAYAVEKETGSEGKETSSEGKETGSEGKETGSEEKETGSEGKETGSEGKETGSEEKETDTEEKETGSGEKETDTEEKETGSEEKETDTEEKETGSEEKETDTEEKETGSGEKETDTEEKETGSEEKETGSEEKETGSEEKETDTEEKETDTEEKETDTEEKETDTEEKETGSEEKETGSEEKETGSEEVPEEEVPEEEVPEEEVPEEEVPEEEVPEEEVPEEELPEEEQDEVRINFSIINDKIEKKLKDEIIGKLNNDNEYSVKASKISFNIDEDYLKKVGFELETVSHNDIEITQDKGKYTIEGISEEVKVLEVALSLKIVEYTVVINKNYGKEDKLELKVEKGGKLKKEDLEKIDRPIEKIIDEESNDVKFIKYELEAWYTLVKDEVEEVEVDFDLDKLIEEDMEIYARWKSDEVKQLSIKFDSNLSKKPSGKLQNMPNNMILDIEEDMKIEKPESEPSYEERISDRYVFKGWAVKGQKETDEIKLWNFDEDLIDLKSEYIFVEKENLVIELVAQWEVEDLFSTGVKESPFKLNSSKLLKELSEKVGQGQAYKEKYFVISEDIDMENEKFNGIGNGSNPFSGNLSALERTGVVNVDKEEQEESKVQEDIEGNLENINTTNKSEIEKIGEVLEDAEEDIKENVDQKDKEEEKEHIGSNKYFEVVGINILDKEGKNVGFFGNLKDAEISNLVLKGKVEGKENVGGLSGSVEGKSKIDNINLEMDVKGKENVGGLSGSVDKESKINDIKLSGNIEGKENVGGFFGFGLEGVKLSDYANENNVVGETNVGGIVGSLGSNANLSGLKNTGEISGKENVGGIVGKIATEGIISNSNNDSYVSGQENVGGILGLADGRVNLKAITNINDIVGEKNVGGIVGKIDGSSVLVSLENDGSIKGIDKNKLNIAGIVGQALGTIRVSDSKNNGNIEGLENIGGIVGQLSNTFRNIERTSNEGNIVSEGNAAGIIARYEGEGGGVKSIRETYNKGHIKGKDVGGILGSNIANTISGISIDKAYNTGDIEGTGLAGGIVSVLPKSSSINNSYNVGNIDGGNTAGGIVAKSYKTNSNIEINSTYVQNSYNYGNISKNGGNIVGTGHMEKNKNNYYISDESIKNEIGETSKTAEEFTSGKVALLLDTNSNGSRNYIWGQGKYYPVLSGEEIKALYKVNLEIIEGSRGTVTGFEEYANGDEVIKYEIKPNSGSILKSMEIVDKKGRFYPITTSEDQYSFKMQEEDIKVIITFMEEPIGEFEVKFKLKDDITKEDIIVDRKIVKAGNRVEKPEDPRPEDYGREGFIFDNWYLKGKPYNFVNAVLENLELEGVWRKENQIKIIYDMNTSEEDIVENKPADIFIEKGNKIIKPENDPKRTSPERTKMFEFLGWSFVKTGGELWDFDQKVETEEPELTLFAQWKESIDFIDGFEFKTAEELKILADTVNLGNTHDGKTFYLVNNIDLNEIENWEGIGYHKHLSRPNAKKSKKFEAGTLAIEATLDGRGHSITLNKDQEYPIIGALGHNGSAKNINIYGKMSPIPSRKSFSGLVRYNYGMIQNIKVELDQEDRGAVSYGEVFGGVAGANYGEIYDVEAKVYAISESSSQVFMGGIVGMGLPGEMRNLRVKSGSHIEFRSKFNMAFSGGAIGTFFPGQHGDEGDVRNVVVEDGVIIKGQGSQVGGIIGGGVGIFSNVYNGADMDVSGPSVGGIVGFDNGGNTNIVEAINKGNIKGKTQVGGISGGKVKLIKDSFSLGDVMSDNGIVAGISVGADRIENTYWYGETLIGSNKAAISTTSSSNIKNSYYGSSDESITDPNDNSKLNTKDESGKLDYTGSQRATLEEFGNGKVAYYLNNVDGIQRDNPLWGVSLDTKLPHFGEEYFVKVEVSGIDKDKGNVTLKEKGTDNKIELGDGDNFIKKGKDYEVDLEVNVKEKDENGEDMGYNFEELEIVLNPGKPDQKVIDLKDKYLNKEDLNINTDGLAESKHEEEVKAIEKQKEKPIEVPDTEVKPGTDNNGNSGSGDSGSGDSGRGDGKGKGDGNGTGEGQGIGAGIGQGLGDGESETEIGLGEGNNTGAEEASGEEATDLAAVETTKEASTDSVTVERKTNESKKKNITDKETEEDIENLEVEDISENEEEAEDIQEEKSEETKEESEKENEESTEEDKLSFVDRMVDKIKANPAVAAVAAISFIGINAVLASTRFLGLKLDFISKLIDRFKK